MPPPDSPAPLALNADPKQYSRELRLQRVAWPLMFLLLLAAALGLFGQGPLAEIELRTEDGRLQVETERFMRRRSDSLLRLWVQPASGQLQLEMPLAYAEGLGVEKVFPEPEHRQASGHTVRWRFAVGRTDAPVMLRLKVRPEALGRLEGWLSVDGGPRLALRHFVYP